MTARTPAQRLGARHQAATLALAAMFTPNAVRSQDSSREEWLRNPAMGNYKAYAEFKMGRYGEARAVWEALAGLGNGDALFNLAVLAEDGLGEPRDLAKAEALYLSAAQAGNFKSQYRLGLLYGPGGALPRDDDRARRFLGMAAEAGDADARARLAALHTGATVSTPFQRAETLGASGRHEDAAALYRQLADGGDRVAQTRLAWMFEAGRGVPRDLGEAARRFALAAQAGEADAQYALAVMLRTGRGRPQDAAQGLQWLRRAAAQGHPAARAALQAEGEAAPPAASPASPSAAGSSTGR